MMCWHARQRREPVRCSPIAFQTAAFCKPCRLTVRLLRERQPKFLSEKEKALRLQKPWRRGAPALAQTTSPGPVRTRCGAAFGGRALAVQLARCSSTPLPPFVMNTTFPYLHRGGILCWLRRFPSLCSAPSALPFCCVFGIMPFVTSELRINSALCAERHLLPRCRPPSIKSSLVSQCGVCFNVSFDGAPFHATARRFKVTLQLAFSATTHITL